MLKSLRKNTFWLLLARLSTQGLGLIFLAVVARRLVVADFGQFTAFASILLVGNTFTTFGTDTLIIRETARTQKITPLITSTIALQLALAVLWLLVTLALRPSLPLLLYSLALFPLAFFSVFSALLRAFERMRLFWGLSLAAAGLILIPAFVSHDLLTLCIWLLGGQILIAIIAAGICSASLPDFRLPPILDFSKLLKATWPFAALTTIAILSQRLGTLTLYSLTGDVSTAYFSSAARIVEGLKIGHFAVLGALLPALARVGSELRGDFRLSLIYMLGLSGLLAWGVTMVARPLITLLYGAPYIPAANLLQILIWSLLPYTISAFISVELVANGAERGLLTATAISFLIFIFLYIVLIRAFGLVGAVWAGLSGEFLQAGVFVWVRKRYVLAKILEPSQASSPKEHPG
ncbi:MAG: oligosaccharide flippase family protein [Anaerolineae bacterium]|nr:oligosaccharide flippase family protein [Anaerolineae bacterium]